MIKEKEPTTVTETLGNLAERNPDAVDEIDDAWLTADDRVSPHMKITTSQGRSIRISLPRGSELCDGDILAFEEGVAVVVRAAPEDLFVITPHDSILCGITGYQLGNLHRPVRFTEEALLTPYDPLVKQLLTDLAVDFRRVKTPFVGKRYGSHTGHSH